MNALRVVLASGILYFLAAMLQHWRAQDQAMALRRVQQVSAMGVIIGTAWAILDRPFWRGAFLLLSVLAFFSFMLPEEAGFLHRHPHLAVALPFATGFAAANFRGGLAGRLCTLAVFAIVVVAIVRTAGNELSLDWHSFFQRDACSTYYLHDTRQC